jgi:hypothetical protein
VRDSDPVRTAVRYARLTGRVWELKLYRSLELGVMHPEK